MTEKGCDNCYYSFFDERAYPCSLCIRGIERTDLWQPSKKTKAERKTELQTTDYCNVCNHKGCDNCVADGSNPHCVPSQYEPWKLTAVEDEPQTDIGTSDTVYSDTAGYVPRVDMTDCSWKKGE